MNFLSRKTAMASRWPSLLLIVIPAVTTSCSQAHKSAPVAADAVSLSVLRDDAPVIIVRRLPGSGSSVQHEGLITLAWIDGRILSLVLDETGGSRLIAGSVPAVMVKASLDKLEAEQFFDTPPLQVCAFGHSQLVICARSAGSIRIHRWDEVSKYRKAADLPWETHSAFTTSWTRWRDFANILPKSLANNSFVPSHFDDSLLNQIVDSMWMASDFWRDARNVLPQCQKHADPAADLEQHQTFNEVEKAGG